MAHSCAITASNRLVVWGTNRQSQLGYSTKLKEVYQPTLFGGQVETKSCAKELASKNIEFI